MFYGNVHFDQILYATCTTDSNKKYSKRQCKISPTQCCKPCGHSLYRYRDRSTERHIIATSTLRNGSNLSITHTQTHTHTRKHTHTQTYTRTYTHTHTHTYTRTYTHTHTYFYAQLLPRLMVVRCKWKGKGTVVI